MPCLFRQSHWASFSRSCCGDLFHQAAADIQISNQKLILSGLLGQFVLETSYCAILVDWRRQNAGSVKLNSRIRPGSATCNIFPDAHMNLREVSTRLLKHAGIFWLLLMVAGSLWHSHAEAWLNYGVQNWANQPSGQRSGGYRAHRTGTVQETAKDVSESYSKLRSMVKLPLMTEADRSPCGFLKMSIIHQIHTMTV